MKLVTNLLFHGNCQQAFERYAAILGGSVTTMISFKDAPAGAVPESARQNEGVMHAWLEAGGQAIMGCDVPPEFRREKAGFSVSFHTSDIEEARRVFEALADGGTITMPFDTVFWSPGFGMLTDSFGTPWIINTNPQVPN